MAILPRKIISLKAKRNGFTLIEVMIVVAIIGIMILIGIWAYRLQLLKGRDARRKADLARWQRMLEDYINDSVCYPEGVICGPTIGRSFESYLSEIPCDPINSTQYNYMYTYESGEGCNKWYKVYAKLENEKDHIITQVGCEGGCGPSNNYNYWVGSPNVTEVAQLPNEFWPDIPGASPPPDGAPSAPPGSTPSPSPGGIPSPSPGGTSPPGASPTVTPSPSPDGPFPSETDPICKNDGIPVCIWDVCKTCCPDYAPYYCDQGGTPEDPSDDKCIYNPSCT